MKRVNLYGVLFYSIGAVTEFKVAVIQPIGRLKEIRTLDLRSALTMFYNLLNIFSAVQSSAKVIPFT